MAVSLIVGICLISKALKKQTCGFYASMVVSFTRCQRTLLERLRVRVSAFRIHDNEDNIV
jgi:hypothetical protein